MAAWLLYGVAVGALLGTSAALFERVLRLNGRAARWAWIVALAGTALLVASGPQRAAAPLASVTVPLGAVVTNSTAGPASLSLAQQLQAGGTAIVSVLGAPLRAAGDLLSRRAGDGANAAIVAGWVLASTALLALFGWTLLRGARERRRWRRPMLHGTPVRVALETGPVVTGVLRPEIVVPEWLLDAGDEEQRLVLAHEREHLRARDPLLLTGSFLLLAMLPWNPAVWWMLARLRLAVEVDCDGRVLQAGASRSAYGSVLLDVAGRRAAGLPGAAAFLESPAQLERRLIAMTNKIPSFGALRSAALAALAAPLVLAACETELPSAAEIEQMDVAAAEEQAGISGVLVAREDAKYSLDGREISADEARRIEATRIASIEVTKDADDPGAAPAIAIFSAQGLAARGGGSPEAAEEQMGRVRQLDRFLVRGSEIRIRGTATFRGDSMTGTVENATLTGFEDVLLFMDGKQVDPADLRTLDPDTIERIEVLKGAAATRIYADPAAARGVIRITTKKAPEGG